MADWSQRYDRISGDLARSAEEKVDAAYSSLLTQPKTVVILALIIAAWFANVGSDFGEQIADDVEIFLPEGAQSTDLLMEVRSEWSTDISLIYIQSPNIDFPGDNSTNISNVEILREISWIEGDADNLGKAQLQRGIDWNKDDHGRQDGVLWIISLAQIIKEVNSSDGRFNLAMCENGINTRIGGLLDCDTLDQASGGGGEYSIPEQDRIDEIIGRSEGGMDALVRDTNGDGIWDTTAVIIGMTHDMSVTGQWEDYSEFFLHVEEIIDIENRPSSSISTKMTLTGLSKVLEDISEEIYLDLVDMLPISLVITVIVITVLHRSWKVVIISGTPIMMALSVTFGASVLLDMTLTPMIIATFPILIGLGVDYALHMINRIEEVRRKRIDDATEENERRRRKGLPAEEPPYLWDPVMYRECVMEMTKSTGVAVVLSALTTVVGFAVLIAPAIVPIIPIRSVGLTLVVGILSTLVFSIIMVPVLAWLLKFNKRTNPPMWGKVSRLPIKHFGLILLVTAAVTGYGLMMMDEMSKPITGSSEAPEGIDSLDTLAEYSEQFGGGQTSLFIFDASVRGAQNDTLAIRDLPVLDNMDALEQRIDAVDQTNTTSVVTFLKAIPVTLQIADGVVLYEGSLWDLLHEECWEADLDSLNCAAWIALDATGPEGRKGIRRDMVNVAFDTLSPEVQSMLMNEAGNKALVYVTQPYMNLNYAGELRDDIDGMLAEEMAESGISTSPLTGGLPVSLDINAGIHDSQSQTTIFTLILLTLVLMLVFRSFRIGIYTMIPVSVVILWQPLLMKSGDVNVNIFTAMIGTIVFGIGVDDAIHVMHRIREEGETPVGISKAIERTGQTIFETTATTISGLCAGLFLSFPGLENFFILMIALITFAFLTSTFLLPSLIACEHTLRHRIKGLPPWGDLGEGPVILNENSESIDAVLEG
ncbi:MAG: efflux RND transporter permease subunit [Candidatus Poseidoniales archaeon]